MQVQPWKIHKKGVGFCLAFFQMIATSLLSNKDSSRLNTYARSSIQVGVSKQVLVFFRPFDHRSQNDQIVEHIEVVLTNEIPYWCLISEDSKYFLRILAAFFLEILQFMNTPINKWLGRQPTPQQTNILRFFVNAKNDRKFGLKPDEKPTKRFQFYVLGPPQIHWPYFILRKMTSH